VDPTYEQVLVQHGLQFWADCELYLINHIEAALRQNLASFLGAQEVANLLDQWAESKEDPDLVNTVLPDDAARLRFGRVLRALVREGVSIAPLGEILRAIQAGGLPHDDVHDAVRNVRLQLAKQLPGNGSRAPRGYAPESFESGISPWIVTQDGRLYLDIPPQVTQALMAEIREFLQHQAPNVTLIARDARIRPFMRQVVEIEFPRVFVIAEEELRPQDGETAPDES
jgi:flagellar biosynthesis component FlhA